MNKVESLLLKLSDDQLTDFAEVHCGWFDSDYYDECEQEDGDWYHPDDMSIIDHACNAIRDWVRLGNIATLEKFVTNTHAVPVK